MRAIGIRQLADLSQHLDRGYQFLNVFAAPPLAPQVSFELRLLADPAHRASARSHLLRPFGD
jgi:hypothetical protein